MAIALIVGCGGGSGPAQFPTQGDLQKLKGAPTPARIANPLLREVDSWDLKDPPAQPPEGTHSPAGPWEQLLAEAAKSRQGLLATTESMNCLAKQLGQFYLAQGGVPSNELSDFMAARCAVIDTEVGSSFQTITNIGSATDDALFQQTRAPIRDLIDKELTSGNQTAGIWFGRLEQKAVVAMVRSPRRIILEHVPFVPASDGHITLRGEILIPAEKADALINQGRFGVKECKFDPQVRLPRFAIDCESNHDDVSASLEIGAFPPARFTGKVVSHLMVWPAGQVGSHFARAVYPVAYDMSPGADLPTSLTSILNTVRKEAGLSAVTLNPAESKTAAEVAPHYFAAMVGAEPESVIDQVVMGLRAGWQIPGLVGYGMFTSSLTRDTTHVGRLLTTALESAIGETGTAQSRDPNDCHWSGVVARGEHPRCGVRELFARRAIGEAARGRRSTQAADRTSQGTRTRRAGACIRASRCNGASGANLGARRARFRRCIAVCDAGRAERLERCPRMVLLREQAGARGISRRAAEGADFAGRDRRGPLQAPGISVGHEGGADGCSSRAAGAGCSEHPYCSFLSLYLPASLRRGI